MTELTKPVQAIISIDEAAHQKATSAEKLEQTAQLFLALTEAINNGAVVTFNDNQIILTNIESIRRAL